MKLTNILDRCKNNNRLVWLCLVSTFVFSIFFTLVYFQAYRIVGPLGYHKSDVIAHADWVKAYYKSYIHQGNMLLAEIGYNTLVFLVSLLLKPFSSSTINALLAATIILSALFKMITWLILEKIFFFVKNDYFRSALTLSLLFLSAIFIPFVSKDTALGVGSPNLFRSPTMTLMVPLMLYFFHRFINEYKSLDFKAIWKNSLLLLLCTTIKPAFTINFIPLFSFFVLSSFKLSDIKRVIAIGVVFLPSVILVILQTFLVYHIPRFGHIIFAPFKEIHYFIATPGVAFVRVAAYPLAACLFLYSQKKADLLSMHSRYAIGLFIFTYLQYALFCFSGSSWHFNDLGWSYSAAIMLLYVYLTKDLAAYYIENKLKFSWSVAVIVFLYGACLLSGIYRFGIIFLGGSYL